MPQTNPAPSYAAFVATIKNYKTNHYPSVDNIDEDRLTMSQMIKELDQAGLLTEKELTKAYIQATSPTIWNKQDLYALRKPTT